MRILFLSATLPHARVFSGSIIIHHRIRLLAERGHQVGLACFLRPEDAAHVDDMRPMLLELETLPRPQPRGMLRRTTDYLLRGLPGPFSELRSDAMRRLVGAMVERSHYDMIIAEFSVMGQFLSANPYLPATRRVISCHGCMTGACDSATDMLGYSPQGLCNRVRARDLQRCEFGLYRSADLVLALTPQDRQDLLRYEPSLRTAVVPYGVDTQHFRPHRDVAREERIVFTGYYSDQPNRDAVLWFAHSVWPMLRDRHPGLTFYVVGAGPTAEMRELSRRDPRIVVTGEVDDVAPFLAQAQVYVCPMRMGTGFRGKILQAMAAGLPVVATTMAAEGVPAHTGDNIILADTPHVMAEGIELLLGDAELRRAVAGRARDMVVKRFSWSHCVDVLENVLQELVN